MCEAKNKRVLIVDDNEYNRCLLKMYLSKIGAQFDESPDGLEMLLNEHWGAIMI